MPAIYEKAGDLMNVIYRKAARAEAAPNIGASVTSNENAAVRPAPEPVVGKLTLDVVLSLLSHGLSDGADWA